MKAIVACALAIPLFATGIAVAQTEPAKPQYQHGDITVPPASADEPIRAEFSPKAATDYLTKGALAWARDRGCVACHTPGTYMQTMVPLGFREKEIHELFLSEFAKLKDTERDRFEKGTKTAQVIYIAAGLATWDKYKGPGKLSAETDEALRFMFELQRDSGTWQSLDCWPPFESSAYQEATVAAMAAATAPEWLEEKAAIDAELSDRVEKLRDYLKTTTPPHDYGRVLLLWTSTRFEGVVDESTRKKIIDLIFQKQHDDGGWSIRDFGDPEQWGKGNRAEKLKAEPEFSDPPSDGHMTGLAVLVLRDAKIPSDDERIQKAVKWLKSNQRESGRWWTRSLNTDKSHFITYSGTAYPLMALARCGALGSNDSEQ